MYQIKQKPEDFVVEEVLDNLEFDKRGNYTYFILEKKGFTTENAIKIIAKKLRINSERFNVAGLKDKNAVTRQHVSVYMINPDRLGKFKFKDIHVEVLGKGNERLMLGQLTANRFKIVVRNVDRRKKVDYVENYFDEQRFGGRNHLLGKALVKKEFRKAVFMLRLNFEKGDYVGALRKLGRKRLRFYVNAYQSLLFNDFLKEYFKKEYKKHRIVDDVYEFVFGDGARNFKVPIVGFLTEYKGDVKKIYDRVLKKEGVKLGDFMIKQIPEIASEGSERDLIAEVRGLKMKYPKDEMNKGKLKCVLEFELGKGSYGTLVVKKVFG